MVFDGNALVADVAVETGRVDDVADLGSAPGAFAFGLADADHGSEKRSEYAGDNHGDSQKGAESGEAEHAADNDAHGRYDESDIEATKGSAHGGLFFFSGRWRLVDLGRDGGAATGAEAPWRGDVRATFWAWACRDWAGHGMALHLEENDSSGRNGMDRTGITVAATCWRDGNGDGRRV